MSWLLYIDIFLAEVGYQDNFFFSNPANVVVLYSSIKFCLNKLIELNTHNDNNNNNNKDNIDLFEMFKQHVLSILYIVYSYFGTETGYGYMNFIITNKNIFWDCVIDYSLILSRHILNLNRFNDFNNEELVKFLNE